MRPPPAAEAGSRRGRCGRNGASGSEHRPFRAPQEGLRSSESPSFSARFGRDRLTCLSRFLMGSGSNPSAGGAGRVCDRRLRRKQGADAGAAVETARAAASIGRFGHRKRGCAAARVPAVFRRGTSSLNVSALAHYPDMTTPPAVASILQQKVLFSLSVFMGIVHPRANARGLSGYSV